MKRLRIAQFFSSDPKTYGGVQNHVYYLSRELERLGHEIVVFGPGRAVMPFSKYRILGRAVSIPWPNGNWVTLTTSDGQGEFGKYFTKTDFDIFHIHEPYIPFLGWQMLKEVKIPIVATFHAAWDEASVISAADFLLPLAKQWFTYAIRAAIFPSETVRKVWQPMGLNIELMTVIPHGVDGNLFMPGAKKSGKNTKLVFLARLVPKKGGDHTLRALDLLHHLYPELHLIIIGRGPEEGRLKRLTRELKLTDCVSFVGKVMEEEKAAYLKSADIFIAPYADEGFGLSVIEAMACGCPVVGFRNRAFGEVLSDYNKNFLVEPGDTQGLAQAINRLLKDASLRRKTGEWCREKTLAFRWDKVAEATEQVYAKIMSKGAKG